MSTYRERYDRWREEVDGLEGVRSSTMLAAVFGISYGILAAVLFALL